MIAVDAVVALAVVEAGRREAVVDVGLAEAALEAARARAVEVGHEVDARGRVEARRRPALVPVLLAVQPRVPVLAVAVERQRRPRAESNKQTITLKRNRSLTGKKSLIDKLILPPIRKVI